MTAKRIQAVLGPYAGQQLDVDEAEADQAIADGWAVDPFAPLSDEPAKEPTEEDRTTAIEAAEKAARKLRGEAEDDAKPKAKAKETRTMEAAAAEKPYKTRNT